MTPHMHTARALRWLHASQAAASGPVGRPRAGAAARAALAACLLLGMFAIRAGAAEFVEGVTEPFRSIDVAAAEPDVIGMIHVKEGDLVKRGQLLAQLDLTVLNSSLKIAQTRAQMHGEVDAAAAEFHFKRDRLLKLQELGETGSARNVELQRAQLETVIAESTLLMAKESQIIAAMEVERIEAQIERRRLRSPIDGVVTQVYKDVAEIVTGNEPKVLSVVQLNPLRAVFSVPAESAETLQVGQRVGLKFSESGTRVEWAVEFVSPVNDAESGTILVKVLLENGAEKYRSGVRCLLELPGNRRPFPAN
jgi:RND family efflux transporter MFP subunit